VPAAAGLGGDHEQLSAATEVAVGVLLHLALEVPGVVEAAKPGGLPSAGAETTVSKMAARPALQKKRATLPPPAGAAPWALLYPAMVMRRTGS
jgi:hypothetical protein